MKDKIKNTVGKLAAVAAMALLLALPAQAAPGVGSQSFGITNAFIGPGLGATALGQSVVSVPYNKEVTLSFKATVANTNAAGNVSTVRIDLWKVDADGNVGTTINDRITWIIGVPLITGADFGTLATNTSFVATTNLTRDVFGAVGGLSLISLTNVNTAVLGGQMLSPVLKVNLKNQISP